jgi:large subunit ribosomal protein L35
VPKIRTKRAAAKRLRKTGSGKWMRRKANKRHKTGNKTAKQMRGYDQDVVISKTDEVRCNRMMPYA